MFHAEWLRSVSPIHLLPPGISSQPHRVLCSKFKSLFFIFNWLAVRHLVCSVLRTAQKCHPHSPAHPSCQHPTYSALTLSVQFFFFLIVFLDFGLYEFKLHQLCIFNFFSEWKCVYMCKSSIDPKNNTNNKRRVTSQVCRYCKCISFTVNVFNRMIYQKLMVLSQLKPNENRAIQREQFCLTSDWGQHSSSPWRVVTWPLPPIGSCFCLHVAKTGQKISVCLASHHRQKSFPSIIYCFANSFDGIFTRRIHEIRPKHFINVLSCLPGSLIHSFTRGFAFFPGASCRDRWAKRRQTPQCYLLCVVGSCENKVPTFIPRIPHGRHVLASERHWERPNCGMEVWNQYQQRSLPPHSEMGSIMKKSWFMSKLRGVSGCAGDRGMSQ